MRRPIAGTVLAAILAVAPWGGRAVAHQVQASDTAADQAQAPITVLIRNVTVIDRVANEPDVLVSLLIADGQVDIVTFAEIPEDAAAVAYNAAGAVLWGKVQVGESATFLLFDLDPRESPEVLLDTKAHAVFAMIRGVVVVNRLVSLAPTLPARGDTAVQVAETGPQTAEQEAAAEKEVEDEKQRRRDRWISNTPPPFRRPADGDFGWNSWETAAVSGMFTGVVSLERQWWPAQDAGNEEQVGALEPFSIASIRALRFGSIGTLNFKRPWVYTVFLVAEAFDRGFDTSTSNSLRFFDYRIDIPVSATSTVSIGKQKEPISMERLMSLLYVPMQERAGVLDATLPSRNVGVVFSGGLAAGRVAYAAGLFNNWFDTGQRFDESPTVVVGRVTGLPFISASEDNLLHVGLGLRYSNARSGLRFRTEGEFQSSPDFVDTGLFEAGGALTYDVEVSWRKGPFWLASEFVGTRVNGADAADPRFSGHHVTASWILTGETRAYNKRSGTLGPVPVSRSVGQGGAGAFEIGARWSVVDLDDGPIQGGEMRVFSLLANWWPTRVSTVSVNLRNVRLDRHQLRGTATGVAVRLSLFLE